MGTEGSGFGLQLKVGGNNLLNVCKLVFKISRNEKNDPFFLEENILSELLSVPPALVKVIGYWFVNESMCLYCDIIC